MLRSAETVELADKGKTRPRGAAGEPAFDAGDGKAGTRRESKGAHPLGGKGGCFLLVKAGFRIAQGRFAEVDYRVRVAVDRLANRALQVSFAAHFTGSPPSLDGPRSPSIRSIPSPRNDRRRKPG